MNFTANEMKALDRLNKYVDMLDAGCKKGELEDDLIDKAQRNINETHSLLGGKANDQRAFVIFEAQAIIHWIKGEHNEAFELINSAKDIKGSRNLRTETGNGILNLAYSKGRSLVNKKIGPGILLILSLVLLYFGGVSGGALGTGLSVGGLVCFVTAIIEFIQKKD